MKLLCLGECLAPALENGTVIEAETASPETLRTGEIVVFSAKGVYSCHRVLFKKREEGFWWFYLKADNTGGADGWIPDVRVGGVSRLGPRCAAEDLYRLWRSRLGHLIYLVRLGVRPAFYDRLIS